MTESKKRPPGVPKESRLVATYTYQLADGTPDVHVDRWEPGEAGRAKTFRPRLASADGYGLPPDHPRVLYRLPEVLAAVAACRPVYLCEGEKDADTGAALGLTTTTMLGGTGGWPAVREHAVAALHGANVVIVADADAAGRKHAARAFADLVEHCADVRILEPTFGKDLADHVDDGGLPIEDLVDVTPTVERPAPELDRRSPPEQVALDEFRAAWSARLIDGRQWVEQASPTIRPIWGDPDGTVWAAENQPTIVAAFSGIGKTTLCQRLALGRIGIPGFETLLGAPVHPLSDDGSRVLYLASDRPDQARLSLRRFVTTEEALELIERRLVIWQGPPPIALSLRPTLLAEMAEEAGARLVVPDSIKDMALKLSDDETGAAINAAHQHCVAAGVDVVAPHHPRKRANSEGDDRRPTIDDLFGSAWIGNGAGSVLFLIREPTSVELLQVKSPLGGEGASLRFQHDTRTGSLTIGERDPVEAAVYDAGSTGISTPGVAKWVHDGRDVTNGEIEQVRRRLRQLEALGIVNERKAGRNKKQGGTWVHHEH